MKLVYLFVLTLFFTSCGILKEFCEKFNNCDNCVNCKKCDECDNCELCHNKRCEESSTTVFFSKDTICSNLLYIQYNPEIIIETNSEFNDSCNLDSIISLRVILSGYYIQPQIANLDTPGNRFEFYPVWLIENDSSTRGLVGSPIILGGSFMSITSDSLPPGDHNFKDVMVLRSDGFNHNEFMFNNIAIRDTFKKAFISRHELLLIAKSSDYVGIGGALIVTNNLEAKTEESRDKIYKSCSKEYFSYKFVGYNDYIESNTGSRRSTHRRLLRQQDYNPAYPTGAIANPCPPMWNMPD